MDVPVMPPVQQMLAKSVSGVPDPAQMARFDEKGLSFEPKWDGLRCLLFRDGDEVELASRNTKPHPSDTVSHPRPRASVRGPMLHPGRAP